MQSIRPIATVVRLITLSLALSAASLACASPAQAWTFKTLYSFSGGADGYVPVGNLLRDETTGDLFGVTSSGGDRDCDQLGCGVIFKLSSAGQLTVLHTFSKKEEGTNPEAGLVRDGLGNLFGTTVTGGITHCNNDTAGCGIIFRLTPLGEYSVLHSFDSRVDGSSPSLQLVRDPATGDLYGGAVGSGERGGIVYKLTTTGAFEVLHTLDQEPYSLIRDSGGTLYGTTWIGGDPLCSCGTVFKLAANGNFKILYTFDHKKSGYPSPNALILDKAGNLYGAGMGRCCIGKNRRGSVFRIAPNGTLKMLHLFDEPDGVVPRGGLALNSSKTLFGTTWYGGDENGGVIYQLTSDRTETILHSFGRSNGVGGPQGLISDENGNLYGASNGADSGYGTVFELVKD